MKIKRIIGLLLLILFCTIHLTYSQSLLDSLYLELAKTNNDTVKVILLNKITREYRMDDPEKAFQYNESAMNLARELEYTPGIARAYDLKGTIYRYRSDYLNALNNYFEAIKLYEQIGDDHHLASTLNFIGIIYDDVADLDKSLEYYLRALKMYENIDNYDGHEGVAILLNNIGVLYRRRAEDSIAMHYFEKAFVKNNEIDRKLGMGYAQMNIGNIHLSEAQFDMAKDYYFEALEHLKSTDEIYARAKIYYNLGTSYIYLDEFDTAFHYLFKSKNLADNHNFLGDIKNVVKKIAEIYEIQGYYQKAYECLLEFDDINARLSQEELDAKIKFIEKKVDFEKEIEKQEYQLSEQSKKLLINKLQKYILLIILLSISIISIIFFNRKRLKIRLINEILSTKDNELINLAIYILQKNDMINDFRDQLLQLQRNLKIEENKKRVDDIIKSLMFKIAISKDIEEFRNKLRIISESFYHELAGMFPDLTDKEIQLATLLRLKLTSKQIGVILDITTESVETSRYRLRKKLELSKDTNLSTFFNQI